jgi:DNA-binding MarR family transcriptional regulator
MYEISMAAEIKTRPRKAQARPTPEGVHLPLSVSRPELLTDESDVEFRKLLHDMLAFSAGLQEVRNRFAQFIGLSGTQYTILQAISRLNQETDCLGISQLADYLHLSGAFVTIEVNKLVVAKLVEKLASQEDRRRVVLSITPEAQKLLRHVARVQCPGNDTLFGGISSKDFKMLRQAMATLSSNIEPTLRLLDYLVAVDGEDAVLSAG